MLSYIVSSLATAEVLKFYARPSAIHLLLSKIVVCCTSGRPKGRRDAECLAIHSWRKFSSSPSDSIHTTPVTVLTTKMTVRKLAPI
jgi:hypothetical protein